MNGKKVNDLYRQTEEEGRVKTKRQKGEVEDENRRVKTKEEGKRGERKSNN